MAMMDDQHYQALLVENQALREQLAEIERQRTAQQPTSLNGQEPPFPVPFAALFDQLPVPIVVYQTDGLAVAINRYNERLIGVSRDWIVGRHNIFADPQAIDLGYVACFERALRGEVVKMPPTAYDTAKALLDGRSDDRLFWSETTYFPIYDETGTIVYIGEVNQDVTERRRAEIEQERLNAIVRANEALLQAILDHLPSWVYAKDEAGRYILANRQFAATVGQSREQLYGKTDEDLYPPEEAARYQAFDREVFTAGTAIERESQMRVNGELRDLYTLKFPLHDETGRCYAVCGMTTDITSRKQAQRERLKLERKLLETQKLESLGLLAGGIAHDFNNLLATILGNAALALEELDPGAPVRMSIEHIQLASRRAADLTRQMLAYTGKGRFVIQSISLNSLVEEMSHLLHASIAKNIVLHYRLDPAMPTIEGDATQLRQIVMNLVINAAEAVGPQGGIVTITTGVQQVDAAYLASANLALEGPEGTYAFLEVADTGVGMDAATRSKIFDPFFSTKFTGRGLGLAAVLGIVRAHRGAINVVSAPGRGSVFTVLLPIDETPSTVDTAAQASQVPWSGSGVVLVVEDEAEVRSLAGRMLERLGFTVLSAMDGPAGVQLFADHKDAIRFVLLDMMMPGLNGAEAFHQLRQIKPDVRVVLMSGYNEQEAVSHFAEKGLAGFLAKPFTPNDLRATIQHILSEG